jgi:CBS domain-containing protein
MHTSTLMSSPAQTCRPNTDLGAVARTMWNHDCGLVPVVNDEGTVVGVITDRDICMAAATRGLRPQEITAEDAMSRAVHVCTTTDEIADALATMKEFTVRRLPVVDGSGRLQGVISMNDIVRASDQNRKPAAADVVSVMAAICSPRHTATLTT